MRSDSCLWESNRRWGQICLGTNRNRQGHPRLCRIASVQVYGRRSTRDNRRRESEIANDWVRLWMKKLVTCLSPWMSSDSEKDYRNDCARSNLRIQETIWELVSLVEWTVWDKELFSFGWSEVPRKNSRAFERKNTFPHEHTYSNITDWNKYNLLF